jgi:hypothetical protein
MRRGPNGDQRPPDATDADSCPREANSVKTNLIAKPKSGRVARYNVDAQKFYRVRVLPERLPWRRTILDLRVACLENTSGA